MSHDTWRFTTGDPDVAESIVQGYGGASKLWETKTDENLEMWLPILRKRDYDEQKNPLHFESGLLILEFECRPSLSSPGGLTPVLKVEEPARMFGQAMSKGKQGMVYYLRGRE